VAVATAVALLPLVALAIEALRANEFAVHADAAVLELRVRDVGGPDTPLVGSYQRFGWYMPGPLFLYVLAVPYRLLGSNFAGLQVGTLLVHGAAIAGTMAIVYRRFGAVPALVALALLSVVARALAPVGLTDVWEPRAVVFPVVLLVVASAVLAAGSTRLLPVVALLTTFLVQMSATVTPAALALALFATVVLVGRHLWARRSGQVLGEPLRAPVVITAVLLAVLWLPPVLHELGGQPSNVAAMWDFLRQDGESIGMADGVAATGLQLGGSAPWMTGRVTTDAWTGEVDLTTAPAVPVALLAVLVGVGLAWWRRDRAGLALGGALLTALGAAILALSRVTELLYSWILIWTWGLGAACWMVAATCSWRAAPTDWQRRAATPLAVALGVAVAVLAGFGLRDVRDMERPRLWTEDVAVAVAPAAVEATRDLPDPVIVRSSVHTPGIFPGAEPGVEHLVLALDRAGVAAVVPETIVHKVGAHRLAEPGAVSGELHLVPGDGSDAPEGFEVVTTVDTLTDPEREELASLEAELRAQGREDVTAEEIAVGDEYAILRLVVGRRDDLRDRPPVSLLLGPPPPAAATG
jgi:hypothetical protein